MDQSKFECFLDDYLSYLSKGKTNDLHALYKEFESNPRLWAPAVIKAKLNQSDDVWAYNGLKKEFSSVQNISGAELMIGLISNSPDVPIEIRKVWNSFVAMENQDKFEKEKIDFLREKLKEKEERNKNLFSECCKVLNINEKDMVLRLKNKTAGLNKTEAFDLLDLIREKERAQ